MKRGHRWRDFDDDETDKYGRGADRRHTLELRQREYEFIRERLQWDLVETKPDGFAVYKAWYVDERIQEAFMALRYICPLMSFGQDALVTEMEQSSSTWNFVMLQERRREQQRTQG
jgi:hypothetical protein